MKPKQFKELLTVKLTEDEIKKYSLQLAKTCGEKTAKEEEKARIAERINSELKLMKQTVDDLSTKVETGEEDRLVECEERPMYDLGVVWIVRLDTWEKIRERPLTSEDRQARMFEDEMGGLGRNEFLEDRDSAIEEEQQQASKGAVAEFFDKNEEPQEGGAVETEEDRARYWAEWREGLSQEEFDKWNGAPCTCLHWRGTHMDGEPVPCQALRCACKGYHCPDCDTKGGHQATCEHYVLGEGTPVQTSDEGDAIDARNHSPNCYVQVIPKEQRTKNSCSCELREQYQKAFAAQADDFTAPRCDECKMIEGGHAPKCSKSNALHFADYLAYAKAHYKSNHQSHARKMGLSKLKDEEIRAWKQQQAIAWEAGVGELEKELQEPKKSKTKKLSPVEAAIDR